MEIPECLQNVHQFPDWTHICWKKTRFGYFTTFLGCLNGQVGTDSLGGHLTPDLILVLVCYTFHFLCQTYSVI